MTESLPIRRSKRLSDQADRISAMSQLTPNSSSQGTHTSPLFGTNNNVAVLPTTSFNVFESFTKSPAFTFPSQKKSVSTNHETVPVECPLITPKPYEPRFESDLNIKTNQEEHLACLDIGFQPIYQNYSREEQRLVDCSRGRKPQKVVRKPGAFGSVRAAFNITPYLNPVEAKKEIFIQAPTNINSEVHFEFRSKPTPPTLSSKEPERPTGFGSKSLLDSHTPKAPEKFFFSLPAPTPVPVSPPALAFSPKITPWTSSSEESEEESEAETGETRESHRIFQLLPRQEAVGAMSSVNPLPIAEEEESRLLDFHMGLLEDEREKRNLQQTTGAPIFTHTVLKHSAEFTQYGLLAGDVNLLEARASMSQKPNAQAPLEDPRLYFNIAAPTSAFICGSQGSGKSHTLSCLLENCLMKSDVNKLVNPLAGLVFHYDTFTSDIRGSPCEAAYLSSNPNIQVKVLCSPTNIETIKRTYAGMNVHVEALRIDQSHLSTKRMLDLMAVNPENGPMPLYLHAINRILREMRIEQQATGASFNYQDFKRRVELTDMTPAQKMPLEQRLGTLESFMDGSQTRFQMGRQPKPKKKTVRGNDWTLTPGCLTIVDLSCPCVPSEGACALFNICLGIFLEQKGGAGRVIALDEAHKYMDSGTEAASLTDTLLTAVRLQRHLGARVFISTQEPTISPKLLDLCSVTIVHRFSSPEWLRCLRLHLAALSDSDNNQKADVKNVFNQIVKLRVGEALLFAPSAIVGVAKEEAGEERMERLGIAYLKIRVRARITEDGGKSVMNH